MFNVVLSEKFKSLQGSINVQLQDFTIISGINGAGKSHLLKAIEEKIALVYDDFGKQLTAIKYVNSSSLAPNESYQVGRDQYINEISSIHNTLQTFVTQRRNQKDLDFDKFIANYNVSYKKPILNVIATTGKRFEEITIEDIKDYTPIYFNLVQDIFYQNFSSIFKRYSERYDDNAYKEFLLVHKGKNTKYLTDEQFIQKYGTPPWEFVNQIFEAANIGYSINDPIEDERDLPYFFRLVNKFNGANVNFSDLSSGEKVLMSLTLSLYNTTLDIDFPQVLLLDEPDGPLHPSMAKQLLDVIQDVFVKEKGVKVIMTTHSPSTIAMAPDDSLYVMQKEEPRLIKRSKEQIMKLLTDGIPSFSIYADNRRQVFVESDVDVYFCSKVYDKLKKLILSDKSLYFISSGLIKGNSGNSDQVKNIVNTLTNYGNQTIFGIVDWDKKNYGNEKISILGLSNRYSLENYIYDPVILSNFLLREKIVERSYFDLEEDDNSSDYPNFSQEKLQTIVSKLLNAVAINKVSDNNTIATVYYINGIALEIPVWYLQSQGHELEEAIKKTYPKLNQIVARGKSESIIIDEKPVSVNTKLKEEIISKVFDELPKFIPVDILNLLQGLHD